METAVTAGAATATAEAATATAEAATAKSAERISVLSERSRAAQSLSSAASGALQARERQAGRRVERWVGGESGVLESHFKRRAQLESRACFDNET